MTKIFLILPVHTYLIIKCIIGIVQRRKLDKFYRIGLIIVIILLVLIIVNSSDYIIKIEPKTTTTIMVTTQPTTGITTQPITTTPSITTTPAATTTPTETTTIPLDCSEASFKFVEGSYVKSKAQLTVTLENTGDVNLTMEYIFFTYSNGLVLRERISGLIEGWVLEAHNTRSFLTSQIEDKFVSGKITTNCPGATVEFTYSDVT